MSVYLTIHSFSSSFFLTYLLLVATVNKYVRLFISYRAARDHVTCISHGVVYVRILINFLVITIAMSDDDDISLCLAATVLSDAGGDVVLGACVDGEVTTDGHQEQ